MNRLQAKKSYPYYLSAKSKGYFIFGLIKGKNTKTHDFVAFGYFNFNFNFKTDKNIYIL